MAVAQPTKRYLMNDHRSASLYFSLIDLWLTKDNRLLNPKSSYERILMPTKMNRFLLVVELHWESLIHRSLNSFSLSFHNFLFFNFYSHFQIPILIIISEISAWRLVFWNSIHMEVASDSFCFLVYSSWLLVFILYVFELFFSFINLYCWKGLHFS